VLDSPHYVQRDTERTERIHDMTLNDAPSWLWRIQAPLVIGVTGHRDLRPEDITHLERKVRHVLSDLHDLYQHTPFILLSSLAEGADRLVARVALSEGKARLVVPLPLPPALYESDFETEASKAEFRDLLSSDGVYSFEMKICTTLADVTHPGSQRDRQYEEAGKYIARQSQILIALWDGVDNRLVGGTAAIVKFQTEGISETANRSIEAPEVFPTYQIVTPRLQNPNPAGHAFTLKIHYPKGFSREDEASKYFHNLCTFLDEFNQDIAQANDSLLKNASQNKQSLIPEPDQFQLLASELLTLDRYGMSDALAIQYQRKMMRAHALLHWIIFSAFLMLVLFAHLPQPEHPTPALALAMLLFATAYLIHRYGSKKRFDSKHQDYRAIAEGLRVRLFWQLAGITDSVADNYLFKQRSELDWIRNGLRGWGIGPGQQGRGQPSPEMAQLSVPECLKLVLVRWVNDQRRYFRRALRKDSVSLERKELLVKIAISSLIGGAAILIAVLVARWLLYGEWSCPECKWIEWPIITLDMLLAAGALLHHYIDRMGYSEHLKQYRRMEGFFRRASKAISARLKAKDIGGARECLHLLGREALAENGDWVLLHRERPLELPHP
jgi:hypothetical protein